MRSSTFEPQEKWEELVVELCQRLTSEEGEEEEEVIGEIHKYIYTNTKYKYKYSIQIQVIGEGRERQTLLHFGASLGLCRLVFLS